MGKPKHSHPSCPCFPRMETSLSNHKSQRLGGVFSPLENEFCASITWQPTHTGAEFSNNYWILDWEQLPLHPWAIDPWSVPGLEMQGRKWELAFPRDNNGIIASGAMGKPG